MSEATSLNANESSFEISKQGELLKKEFPSAVIDFHAHRGDETVVIERDLFVNICSFLRDDPRCSYELMIDLTAVDRLEMNVSPRFEMVYHFKSLTHAQRLRLKVVLPDDDCKIPSIHHLWKAVDWYERECFDMFGIIFEGHPNLSRILLYDEFEGHPLRKDYPIDKQQPLQELKEVDERHNYGRHA